jgi:hypothetical protein
MIDSHKLALVPLVALGIFAGCSSTDTPVTMITPVEGSGGSTVTSGGHAGASGQTGSAGSSAGTDGNSAGGSTGSGGAADADGSAGTGMNDRGPDPFAHKRSSGCGNPWMHDTNTWVEVAGPATHTNPAPLGPLVTISGPASQYSEDRGYWVFVPKNYDPNKADGYKVIYSGVGCDDPDRYHSGKTGYQYQKNDNDDAIQVGLDYDTHSFTPQCYDNRNPKSNDFTFMPWLMNEIEKDFCVDLNHQFFSGFSSGGWVAQQFNCAFPTKFRGMVSTTGSEPADQPMCNPGPVALFHIHDINDAGNTYASFLPGCTRVLKQNGCTVTDCRDPQSDTLTSPYTLPPDAMPNGTPTCRQFNGCPADYPVVFCTTHLPNTLDRHGAQPELAVPAFWDFVSKLK